jgi:hypothetical protein
MHREYVKLPFPLADSKLIKKKAQVEAITLQAAAVNLTKF